MKLKGESKQSSKSTGNMPGKVNSSGRISGIFDITGNMSDANEENHG